MRKYNYLFLKIMVLLFFIEFVSSQMIRGIFAGTIVENFSNDLPMFLLITVILVICLLKKVNLKETFKLRPVKWSTILLCIPIFFAMQFIVNFLSSLYLYLFGTEIYTLINGLLLEPLPLPLQIISLAVFPALFEELLFRGLLLDDQSHGSIHRIALTNGIAFGLFHLNLFQFSYAWAIGAILAYLTLITRSIFPAMLLHFMNNGYSLIIELFGQIFFGTSPDVISETPEIPPDIYLNDLLSLGLLALIGLYVVYKILLKLVDDYAFFSHRKSLSTKETKHGNWFITYLPIILFAILTLYYEFVLLT